MHIRFAKFSSERLKNSTDFCLPAFKLGCVAMVKTQPKPGIHIVYNKLFILNSSLYSEVVEP